MKAMKVVGLVAAAVTALAAVRAAGRALAQAWLLARLRRITSAARRMP